MDLDYCDIEWFALETNRDHSVIFEIASKYFILESFIDYDGYSISSKGFLPTVVDIMDIWVKFTHSSPKPLQMVTAAMKLKDACSLEGKLWPT